MAIKLEEYRQETVARAQDKEAWKRDVHAYRAYLQQRKEEEKCAQDLLLLSALVSLSLFSCSLEWNHVLIA